MVDDRDRRRRLEPGGNHVVDGSGVPPPQLAGIRHEHALAPEDRVRQRQMVAARLSTVARGLLRIERRVVHDVETAVGSGKADVDRRGPDHRREPADQRKGRLRTGTGRSQPPPELSQRGGARRRAGDRVDGPSALERSCAQRRDRVEEVDELRRERPIDRPPDLETADHRPVARPQRDRRQRTDAE